MESFVKELKKLFKFKDSTEPGDVLLVAVEEPRAVFYAVVIEISRDESKRDEWWHLTLSILNMPPQEVVWTLREPQFIGKEIFTVAGVGRFIQAVDFMAEKQASPGKQITSTPAQKKKKHRNSGSKKGPVLRVIK